MKKEDRQIITKQQINRFFQSYYSEWRHIQVLAIKKKMKDKYIFYADIIETIQETDNGAGDLRIAQEITNGLMFEAVQNCLQYIEDLFALMKASENKDFFIRDIITYSAGSVINKIRVPKTSKESVCKQFFFPYQEVVIMGDTETGKILHSSINLLIEMIKEISEFYKKHEYFYNQFKHGLTIALTPFMDYNADQVKEDKSGKFNNFTIVAIDSCSFKKAPKNQYGNSDVLLIVVAKT